MSQRDLVAELRGARPAAPEHLREQVRLIAAAATPPAKRITWRRALVVALPVAAAVAATVVLTRPENRPTAPLGLRGSGLAICRSSRIRATTFEEAASWKPSCRMFDTDCGY